MAFNPRPIWNTLPVVGRALETGGKDWWKLGWRPIRHTLEQEGTWCLWVEWPRRWKSSGNRWGFSYGGPWFCREDWNNGWGRHKKALHVCLKLVVCQIHFWVAWDHMCMSDGPGDYGDRQEPIVIPEHLA